MIKKYARLLEQRIINEKTESVWAIQDVPGTWREGTRTKVEGDGYYFEEDGTAMPTPINEGE